MVKSIIQDKSYSFSLKLVLLVFKLQSEKQEFSLTKQLLKSGTAIGALVEESMHAESNKDFVHIFSIANKEANETRYWIRLLRDSGLLDEAQGNELIAEVEELIKMLVSSIKTMKSRLR